MTNVVVVKFPGAVNDGAVFRFLFRGDLAAVRGDRHDIGRAVGKPDAGSAKSDLHHTARKITGGMKHILVRGGDAAAGGVIVGDEMRRGAAAAPRLEQEGKRQL